MVIKDRSSENRFPRPRAPQPAGRGGCLPRLTLVLISATLALLVAELMTRQVEPRDPYLIVPLARGEDGPYRAHPTRGHSFRPGFRGRFIHPDYAGEEVSINSFGFRDLEPSAVTRNAAVRVTVLGDSLAFGLGVEGRETFPALLQEQLAGVLDSPVVVFNTGVPGYGPAQELMVLREMQESQRPDLAVVALYTGNDLEDALRTWRSELVDQMVASPISAARNGRVSLSDWRFDGAYRRAVYAHPPTEIRVSLAPGTVRPGAELRLGLAVDPEVWQHEAADGVTFSIHADSGDAEQALLEEHVTPGLETEPCRWRAIDLPLGISTIIFRTTGGPQGNEEYDWAHWVAPRIVNRDCVPRPQPELSALGSAIDDSLLVAPQFSAYWQRAAQRREDPRHREWWEARSVLLRRSLRLADMLGVRWGWRAAPAVTNFFLLASLDRKLELHVQLGMACTMSVLESMQQLMAERGGKLVVLLIPAKFQTEPETMARHAEHLGLPAERFDAAQPQRLLTGHATRRGLRVVDLLPVLRAAAADGRGVFFDEGHLNRRGHRLVAAELARVVVEQLRAGTAPPPAPAPGAGAPASFQ